MSIYNKSCHLSISLCKRDGPWNPQIFRPGFTKKGVISLGVESLIS
jgi:hypothetical protein